MTLGGCVPRSTARDSANTFPPPATQPPEQKAPKDSALHPSSPTPHQASKGFQNRDFCSFHELSPQHGKIQLLLRLHQAWDPHAEGGGGQEQKTSARGLQNLKEVGEVTRLGAEQGSADSNACLDPSSREEGAGRQQPQGIPTEEPEGK